MNKKSIPICQARDILNIDKYFRGKGYLSVTDVYNTDLLLCWEYFDANYERYCFKLKSNNTIENDLHNLYKFQLSFPKLPSSQNGNKIFTLENDKPSTSISYANMLYRPFDKYYVSDTSGFAMILLSGIDLKVCYYDFDLKFTCHVKILLPVLSRKEFRKDVRLSDKSIWIVSYISGKGCVIDAINIKNEKEWYHVRSNCNYAIELKKVFSGIMFLGSNNKDYFGDRRKIFSSYKALYIDHCNLIPCKTNEKCFIEFFKPKELESEDIIVGGIFKATIIVAPKTHSKVCYSLTYNERLDLKVCKRIDLTGYFDKKIRDIGILKFLPQIGKMLVYVSPTYIAVINLKMFRITQILECPEEHSNLDFRCSYDAGMLNMVYEIGNYRFDKVPYLLLKFVLYNRQSLKELALNTILDNFSLEEIEAFNLPRCLIREIMARKIH